MPRTASHPVDPMGGTTFSLHLERHMVGPQDVNLLGFVGVSLLLIAFFLNLIGVVRAERPLYMALNLVGAALACFSSYLIRFMPFVILEGTWAVVAITALLRVLLGRRKSVLARKG